jgi:hypothetical protein
LACSRLNVLVEDFASFWIDKMHLLASRADDWFKDGSGVVAVQGEPLDIQVGVRTAKNK